MSCGAATPSGAIRTSTRGVGFWRAYKKGAKLIVIDPRKTFPAKKADIWLQVRPGTDAALALGFFRVIVDEELYDKEFVDNHIHGWEPFLKRLEEFPLERGGGDHLGGPGADQKGGPDLRHHQARRNTLGPAHGAKHKLHQLHPDRSGPHGRHREPGRAGRQCFFSYRRRSAKWPSSRPTPSSARNSGPRRLGGDQYKLAARMTFITPKPAWDAILTGKPYPIKACYLMGTNPVITRANAREVYKALSKLDFLAVTDHFLTPTAELADIFLPAGTWLEHNHVADNWKFHGFVLARQKAVEIGECWQNHKIFMELGKRMGQEWWDTVEDALDWLLEPSGLTWEEFKERGYLQGEMTYYKHKERGFSTPHQEGRALFHHLREVGAPIPCPGMWRSRRAPTPDPTWPRSIPTSSTAVCGSRPSSARPTGNNPGCGRSGRTPLWRCTRTRRPSTASRRVTGVWLESPRGRIKQRAKMNQWLDPRVVAAEYGWWYPEIKDPGHGWDISNINILTDNSHESMDPIMGTTNLRVLLCSISRCDEG